LFCVCFNLLCVLLCGVCFCFKQMVSYFFVLAEDGIRVSKKSRGLGVVYKRMVKYTPVNGDKSALAHANTPFRRPVRISHSVTLSPSRRSVSHSALNASTHA